MQIGVVGLGRMGGNIVRRLQRAGHSCVVNDVVPAAAEALRVEGATPAASLGELVAALEAPRAVWVMVPAAFAATTVREIASHMEPGDVVIDGGNSNHRDAVDQAADLLTSRGVHFVDIGTSGGVHGLERGYCLMIGGAAEAVERLAPIFDALAPGIDTAPRTRGRTGAPVAGERGWLHCGGPGAGHFVKMVHNGIEYGLMAAYAEGLNLLRHAGMGGAPRAVDAETAPLREPQYYRYDIDVGAVAEVWRRGSVVSSWLLDLTAAALADDPSLDGFGGRVSDSGEGRWTLNSAIDLGVPVPVLATALFERFSSQGNSLFADKLLSAMRKEFGGHLEKAKPSTHDTEKAKPSTHDTEDGAR